jgi:hypothetical protein
MPPFVLSFYLGYWLFILFVVVTFFFLVNKWITGNLQVKNEQNEILRELIQALTKKEHEKNDGGNTE